ncbi:uncharacterized protein LOC132644152 [Lycium barbarum]|uniref:uncharacterized protein LOC132644152 n=1 Tax=Lycium barbarum TaxID=112863 RepID=UPI00293E8212|nr:uncharacterized protein LOC132644152 [Lycium barbarum]
MWNKYCKRKIPMLVQWKGGSQLWKNMLEATDAIEQDIKWEPRDGSANFWCCSKPPQETMEHVFLTSDYATSVWKVFADAVGVQGPFVQIKQTVKKWWDTACSTKLKPLYPEAPAIIMWQLWKRRNAVVHVEKMSRHKVLYEINLNLIQLAKTRYPWLKNMANSLPHLVQQLEGYRPHITYTMVQWCSPDQGWYKCNSDGASKGNPGPSTTAFCVRNHDGDFIYVSARRIEDTTINYLCKC